MGNNDAKSRALSNLSYRTYAENKSKGGVYNPDDDPDLNYENKVQQKSRTLQAIGRDGVYNPDNDLGSYDINLKDQKTRSMKNIRKKNENQNMQNQRKSKVLEDFSYSKNEKDQQYNKADENWGKEESKKEKPDDKIPDAWQGIADDWNDGTISGKAKAIGKGALGVAGTALSLPVLGAYGIYKVLTDDDDEPNNQKRSNRASPTDDRIKW